MNPGNEILGHIYPFFMSPRVSTARPNPPSPFAMFDNLFISYSKWFLDICPILKQEDNLSQISVTAYSIHFHLSSSRDGHLLHLQSEKGSCGVNDQITVYLSVLYDKGKSYYRPGGAPQRVPES